ncbi:conjugal transfer ATP-binding protein TraC [Anaerohalosphaera lusitana]|uniref:Conjugal transfer ATP-binding protein TraC n=1 Tax=Anaerohalosphaera lusitana TaxID=1936003 RepID=A0A1U9NLB8_9BACT|nr:DUF87 domain-containing protein [Anaerohalosphaera lusitana]AQT68733.1 conjugal transfer ATP-binding protein TraC [Anaerohalosphaera lusitana]
MRLKPILGKKIDSLWKAYLLSEGRDEKADILQTLEILAEKHLGSSIDNSSDPFPPPDKGSVAAGDIELGTIRYAGRDISPLKLKSDRLKEHLLVAGRSGSGKTNLTFVLVDSVIRSGIKVLALDWKRGYRDLKQVHPDLKVYTVGRDISPFRFNPLIPPPGCEPNIWIKLIVDVIADAYLGGEGVISLLVSGLEHLYNEFGVYEGIGPRWPTIKDLLGWLKNAKLKGRAAQWQASAQRILMAMTYGEFGRVVETQDNSDILKLLDENCVLEMDGLSANTDKVMFSEALALYVYRHRLAQGPRDKLTNLLVIEEAHNLLHAKQAGSRESVLENSIRMVRQYGLGYVFVDQSASLLSKVAFANSYATIALSQKLRSDITSLTSAMNLDDDQKSALSQLERGEAIVKIADCSPRPFRVKLPLFEITEGEITDAMLRSDRDGDSARSGQTGGNSAGSGAVSDGPEKEKEVDKILKILDEITASHPPADQEKDKQSHSTEQSHPPSMIMTREMIRFLDDIVQRPLSSTVKRYNRLRFSRRRGNAIKKELTAAGIIDAVSVPTRTGQVVLLQISDNARGLCIREGIFPPRRRESIEHLFWKEKAKEYFADLGYDVSLEHSVTDNGVVDLVAKNHREKIAVEVETGKSDIAANIKKLSDTDFDRLVLVATNASAVDKIDRAIAGCDNPRVPIERLCWLDIS